METLLSVIIAIMSIVMIVTVATTESDQAGLGTLSGDESSAMWGEHKGTSKKEMQNKIIKISSIIFGVALVILAAI